MTTPAATTPASAYTPPAAGARFVWHDLMSTDPGASLAFYSALFGWTTTEMALGEMGAYHMLAAGDATFGGLVPLDASHGLPSHWMAYVGTHDVDATCTQVDAAGGRTCVPPTDIPGVGRFAVVEDPSGAIFSPFTSGEPAPADDDGRPKPGTIVWNELMTSDPERMRAFYGQLLGWATEGVDMGPMGTYWLFKRGGEMAGGMMQMPAGSPARPHWLPYVDVASADDAAARIPALGGAVLVAPTDIQDWGRFTVAQDPTGAVFAMLQNKQPM